jgi:membrane glycosyltransferase
VKRDRRWCQGNLQHLRILFRAHGLHPISRLHLACGIAGYIASPLWMALVLAAVSFGPSGALILPAVGAGALILMQKLAGIAVWLRRRPGARTLRLVLHRAGGELLLSTLLAPVIMVRQSAAVLAVALGRDCGWKPASRSGQRAAGGEAWLEPLVALGLILAVLPGPGDAWQLLLVTPIALPLFAAPFLARWFNHVPQHSVQPLREPQVISLHQALAHQGLATQR